MEDLLEFVLKTADKYNIPFVETRGEDTTRFEIESKNGEVKRTISNRRIGIGIKVLYKGAEAYSYTSILTKDEIEKAVLRAFKAARVGSEFVKARLEPIDTELKSGNFKPPTVKVKFSDIPLEKKKEQIDITYNMAKEIAKRATMIRTIYGEFYGTRYFMNSESVKQTIEISLTGISAQVIERENDIMVAHRDSKGGVHGFEFYKYGNVAEELGKEVAEIANIKLGAKAAPAGKFRALIHNDLVGVLAHESFGHLTEGDFVVSGESPLKGKLGTRLGSEHATIYDEGTPKEGGFWIPVDDEGVKTTKTLLLDKGILRGYLHSRETAKLLNMEPTGNARAVDVRFPPIPRMKNTYFAPGDLNIDEKFEILKDGIYAIKTLGGQVTSDGTFMFKASYAYLIENGEIKEKYREVTLMGHIFDLLKNVEGAFNDLKIRTSYFGGCGKGNQYPLPVGLGGPHLLLKEAHFGGE